MTRYEVAIKFKSGLHVTLSHEMLFVEIDMHNDFWSGYITEEDLALERERRIAGRNTTTVRVGVRCESRSMIKVEDASVDYVISGTTQTVRVTKGVVTDGSIPFAFGLDFDEIIFRECHEERTP